MIKRKGTVRFRSKMSWQTECGRGDVKPLIWHECMSHFEVVEVVEWKENCCHDEQQKQKVLDLPSDAVEVSAFCIHARQNHIHRHSSTQSRYSEQSLYPETCKSRQLKHQITFLKCWSSNNRPSFSLDREAGSSNWRWKRPCYEANPKEPSHVLLLRQFLRNRKSLEWVDQRRNRDQRVFYQVHMATIRAAEDLARFGPSLSIWVNPDVQSASSKNFVCCADYPASLADAGQLGQILFLMLIGTFPNQIKPKVELMAHKQMWMAVDVSPFWDRQSKRYSPFHLRIRKFDLKKWTE